MLQCRIFTSTVFIVLLYVMSRLASGVPLNTTTASDQLQTTGYEINDYYTVCHLVPELVQPCENGGVCQLQFLNRPGQMWGNSRCRCSFPFEGIHCEQVIWRVKSQAQRTTLPGTTIAEMSFRARLLILTLWIVPIALAIGLFAGLVVLVCLILYCRERRLRARKPIARVNSGDESGISDVAHDPQNIPLMIVGRGGGATGERVAVSEGIGGENVVGGQQVPINAEKTG